MSVESLERITLEPLAKLTAAAPVVFLAVKVTLATTWSPVTPDALPRAICTEPLPPELSTSNGKADDDAMLTKSNLSVG